MSICDEPKEAWGATFRSYVETAKKGGGGGGGEKCSVLEERGGVKDTFCWEELYVGTDGLFTLFKTEKCSAIKGKEVRRPE